MGKIDELDLKLGKALHAKEGVKGSEIVKEAAKLGVAIVQTITDKTIGKKVDLQETGDVILDRVSLFANMAKFVIEYSDYRIREEGVIDFFKGLPDEWHGLIKLANRGVPEEEKIEPGILEGIKAIKKGIVVFITLILQNETAYDEFEKEFAESDGFLN